MPFDFATILVIAAAVTGFICLLDIFVLRPRRVLQMQSASTHQAVADQADKLPWFVDFSRSFFPVILIVLILRSFIIEPFRIPSGSMEPTLYDGDFILVNKFSYGLRLPITHNKIISFGEPQRGDVVVFRYPDNPALAYIKRVVGLPGDYLEYRNKQLFINGEAAPQQALPPLSIRPNAVQFQEQLGDITHLTQVDKKRFSGSWNYRVPQQGYFVMGDNRDNSSDSRVWGVMPEENLIGKAFFIWMNSDCITLNGNCSRIGNSIN